MGGFMEFPPVLGGFEGFVDAEIQFALSQPEIAAQLLIRETGRLLESMFFYFGNGEPSLF